MTLFVGNRLGSATHISKANLHHWARKQCFTEKACYGDCVTWTVDWKIWGSKIWYLKNICYQIHIWLLNAVIVFFPIFPLNIFWNLRSNLN